MTKLMQISSKVDQDLDELAKITGMSRQILLEKAVEAFLKKLFLKKTNEEFAAIKAHPDV